MNTSIELKPHQKKAIENLDNGKILLGGVGTGKTLTALGYYLAKESDRKLLVITTAKKRDSGDWVSEAARLGISEITVDSWQNINKYENETGIFLIADEQRVVGSGEWSKAFIKIAKSNRWILLSATPGDKWEDYIPVFIANGWYKNRSEFKRNHCVYSYYGRFPKLERYLGVSKLIRLRNELLVEMPFERHTKRHIHEIEVDYDRELFEKVMKKRWHVYEDRPLKDVSEMFGVMRKVVNSDKSRLEALSTLMERHPRVIVFYNFDYELESLRTLAKDAGATKIESSSKSLSDVGRTTDISSRYPQKTKSNTSIIPTPTKTSTRSGSETTSDGSESRTLQPSSESSVSDVLSRRTTDAGFIDVKSGSSLGSELSKQGSVTIAEWNGQQISHDSQAKDKSWTTNNYTNSSVRSESQQTIPRSADSSSISINSKKRQSSEEWKETPKPNFSDQDGVGRTAVSEMRSTMGVGFSPLINSSVTIAEWNGHKHEPVPDTERWVYLVQYVAGAEAWDCISTDTIVFYSLTYSYKNFMQAQGRIDRMNTPFTNLHYYVLASKSLIDRAVLKSLRGKKNFNERDLLREKVG